MRRKALRALLNIGSVLAAILVMITAYSVVNLMTKEGADPYLLYCAYGFILCVMGYFAGINFASADKHPVRLDSFAGFMLALILAASVVLFLLAIVILSINSNDKSEAEKLVFYPGLAALYVSALLWSFAIQSTRLANEKDEIVRKTH